MHAMKKTFLLKYYSIMSTVLATLNEAGSILLPGKYKPFHQSRFVTVFFLAITVYFIYSIRKTKRHINTMGAAFFHFVFNSMNKDSRDRLLAMQTYDLVQLHDFKMLKEGLDLDANTYDEENTWSIPRWRDFHAKNPRIAYSLYRRDDVERLRILGGISVFPLTNDAYNSLVGGLLRENGLTQDHILSPGDEQKCRYWLIPGVVVFGEKTHIKAAAIFSLFVIQIYPRISFPVTFIAVGYSIMGVLLLKKMRFRKVAGNADIYSITFSSHTELTETISNPSTNS